MPLPSVSQLGEDSQMSVDSMCEMETDVFVNRNSFLR